MLVLYFVTDAPWVGTLKNEMTSWVVIMTATSLVYSSSMTVLLHTRRLISGGSSRMLKIASVTVLGAIALYAGAALLTGTQSDFTLGLFNGITSPIGRGSYLEWALSLWACYRLIRFTNLDTILFGTGFVVTCISMIPVLRLYIPPLMDIEVWLMGTFRGGASRAMVICLGVSSVIIAARAIIGREPSLIEMEIT
jgi:hypothetical protein